MGKRKNEVVEMPEKESPVFEHENIVWIGETGFEADADKLIIVVDEFRSGYECRTCFAKDLRMNPQISKCHSCSARNAAGRGRGRRLGILKYWSIARSAQPLGPSLVQIAEEKAA